MQIKKYDQIPEVIKKALEKEGVEDLRIGDIFILVDRGSNYNAEIIRICGLENDKKYGVYVFIETTIDVHGMLWEPNNYYSNGKPFAKRHSLKDFKEYYINRSVQLSRGKTVKEYYEEAMNLITGKTDIKVYQDHQSDTLNNETGLISKNSKQALILLQKDLEEKRQHAELIHSFVKLEMERRRQELEKIREQMYGVVAEFNKKLKKIMRVITTIELYLGIDEEIFQIQEGPKTSADTPISFRQALLYMDEETGHWEDGGLDFEDIKWFDEWLFKDSNFKNLIPEEKGVVVFRPRREKKDYGGGSENWYQDALKNCKNLGKTYLLIRNGERLYRIYTDKIVILPRLFPQRKEFEAILKEINAEKWEHRKEDSKEKLEDMAYQYRKRAVLLQGLIDRSEVFTPMSQKLSVFNMDATPGMVNFIYDDELALPTGRLSFHNWWKKLDEGIKVGSRILITGHYNPKRGWHSRGDFNDRFYNRSSEHNTPELPNQGVYLVEEFYPTSIDKMRKSRYENLLAKYPNKECEEKEEYYSDKTKTKTFRLLKIKKDFYRYGEINGSVDTSFENYGKGDCDCYFVLWEEKEPHFTIKYQPGGDARKGWNDWGERKNKVRFRIYPDDIFLMNYDQLDLKDVEFYLTSRVDRPNYLDMMPLLLKIKEERLKEFQQEKEFIKFIVSRNIINLPELDEVGIRKRVIVSLVWWKYKNKIKRPITKDDTLALRMIEKRITSKNYDKLKNFDK